MCDRCKEAMRVAPWHRHTKLMVEQCERRETMQRIREQAGRSAPKQREVGDEDAVWLSCLGLALILTMFFVAWGLL